jgi:hypothetical protein
MEVQINPQHVIDNLKQQVAQKAEESAINAAAAAAAAEQCEELKKQLEDARKEIDNLSGGAKEGKDNPKPVSLVGEAAVN